ncbi:MAG TPA: acylphosphatase [Xanthomonadales bacterium]|nr:acylphosphatase [Xanthomonadales bacterium]
MKQAHIFVSGVVQGVGYRYFVRSNARKLGLTGWVRNTTNGKVEAVLRGSQEQIEQMLALCRQGPMLSEVKNIQLEWEEGNEEFESFEVRK